MPDDGTSRDASPETPRRSPSRLGAWLELLRLPNLFTVPGDPIAGFLLASLADLLRGTFVVISFRPPEKQGNLLTILCCALASLFLYMAGLITNDLFDLEEDRGERPARPLPSGRIRSQTAVIVAVVFFALGIISAALAGFASLLVAGALGVLILVYNAGAKRVAVLGPLNMGLCRGLSLLIGAAALGAAALVSPAVLVAAGGLTLYVASVTLIAAGETTGRLRRWLCWAPSAVAILWVLTLDRIFLPGWPLTVLGLFLSPLAIILAVGWSFAAWKAAGTPAISGAVGGFLRALLVFQATMAGFCSLFNECGFWSAVAFTFALLVSGLLSRRFYAS